MKRRKIYKDKIFKPDNRKNLLNGFFDQNNDLARMLILKLQSDRFYESWGGYIHDGNLLSIKEIDDTYAEVENEPLKDDPGIVSVLENNEVIESIMTLKGSGNLLNETIISSIDQKFEGLQVFYHEDSIAILLCELFNARAFAVGNHVFFNEGELDLNNKQGQLLLVHELEHVYNNNGGRKLERQIKKLYKRASKLDLSVLTEKQRAYFQKIFLKCTTQQQNEFLETYPAFSEFILPEIIIKSIEQNENQKEDINVQNDNNRILQEETVVVPSYKHLNYPPLEDRKNINQFRELTEKQKHDYKWDAIRQMFRLINPDLSDWRLDEWIRISLIDGWSLGQTIPEIDEVFKSYDIKGIPVYEARTFPRAWKAMRMDRLPKDAPFWFRNKWTGDVTYHTNSVSGNLAWNNHEINYPTKVKYRVDFDGLRKITGDDANYQAIIKKNVYVDQIASNELVVMTKTAQQIIYPGQNEKATGIYTEEFDKDLRQKVYEMSMEDEINFHRKNGGIILNEKYSEYLIDGFDKIIKVNVVYLEQVRSILHGKDQNSNFIIESIIGIKHKIGGQLTPILMLLTSSERIQILNAYYALDKDLEEEDQTLILMMFENTPSVQGVELRDYLTTNSYNKIGFFRDVFGKNDKLKKYYEQVERLIPGFVSLNFNKELDVEFEGTSYDLPEGGGGQIYSSTNIDAIMSTLTDRQVLALRFDQRTKLFSLMSSSGEEFIKPSFVRALELIPPAQIKQIVDHFTQNNYSFLNYFMSIIYERASSTIMVRVENAINEILGNNQSILATTKAYFALRDPAKIDKEILSFLLAAPISFFDTIDIKDRALFVQLLNNEKIGSWSNDIFQASLARKLILKIVRSIGFQLLNDANLDPIVADKRAAIVQQEFYDKLKIDYYSINRNPNAKFDASNNYGAFQFEAFYNKFKEEDRLEIIRLLNQYNKAGYESQIRQMNYDKSYFGADETIAENIHSKNLPLLSWEERKDYILKILGGKKIGIITGSITQVGAIDENTILLILQSIEGTWQISMLFEWLGENDGAIYKRLHSRLDGEEFKNLHITLSTLARKLESSTLENQGFTSQERRDELMTEGSAEDSSMEELPWASPKFFENFKNDKIRFDVSWGMHPETKKRKIVVVYYYAAPDFLALLSPNVAKLCNGPEITKYYDPWDTVPVRFLFPNETTSGKKEIGDLLLIPAINLFWLENYQEKQDIQFVIDTVGLLLAIAELVTATTPLGIIFAALDVLVSSINVLYSGGAISEENQSLIDAANTVFLSLTAVRFAPGAFNATANTLRTAARKVSLMANRKALMAYADSLEKVFDNLAKLENITDLKLLDDIEAHLKNVSEVKKLSPGSTQAQIFDRMQLLINQRRTALNTADVINTTNKETDLLNQTVKTNSVDEVADISTQSSKVPLEQGNVVDTVANYFAKMRQQYAANAKRSRQLLANGVEESIDNFIKSHFQQLNLQPALVGNALIPPIRVLGGELEMGAHMRFADETSPAWFKEMENGVIKTGHQLNKMERLKGTAEYLETLSTWIKSSFMTGFFSAAESTTILISNTRKIFNIENTHYSDEILEGIIDTSKQELKSGEELFSNLSQVEKEMLADYLLAHPTSGKSLDDIIFMIREEGKVLDPDSKYFYTPGSKGKPKPDIPHQALSSDSGNFWDKTMEQLAAERQKARLDARQKAIVHGTDSTVYKKAMQNIIKKSEALGEAAALQYVLKNYPGATPVFPVSGVKIKAKQGILDLVFQHKVIEAGVERIKYIVVEAKGGASDLGSRIVGNAEIAGDFEKRAEQGSRAYLFDIIKNMETVDGGVYKKLSDTLQKALVNKQLEYISVKQPFNVNTGALEQTEITKFKIY